MSIGFEGMRGDHMAAGAGPPAAPGQGHGARAAGGGVLRGGGVQRR